MKGTTVRKIAFCALAATLLLAGCSSAGASSEAEPQPAAQTLVQVPDAYTSVTVEVLNTPAIPVKGTDGKYHVAYELGLQNASAVTATIDKIDVVDAKNPATVIASFAGSQLVDATCEFGDCNRLRLLPSQPAENATIPAQEGRVVLVDFSMDTLDGAPTQVLHHLYAQGAARPGNAPVVPIDYLAAPYVIGGRSPMVIGPPLKGDNWVAMNGCCEPGFPHRDSVAPFNGHLYNPQRFAIDWIQLDENGRLFEGDPKKNESYGYYGSEIIAVGDGTVVATLDELEPNTPGILPANDPAQMKNLTVENVDGNHIVIDLGDGVFVFYAHLQKGTLKVKVGDRVTKGQSLALLGNTGNSNAPHLHMQLMDTASVLGSDGLPYVIDSFDYDGQIDPQQIWDADTFIGGDFFGPGKLAKPERRTNELPMAWAIVDFGTS